MGAGIDNPKLSVVLPVYNGEEYIAEAMKSILTQSYKDFELIIVNDGSTDKTAKILDTFKDKRIKVVTQSNHGLVYSLNRAVREAKALLIARHDADDFSLPKRFEKQMKLFARNPDLVLAGSSIQVMDMDGAYLHDHMVLLDNPELKQELLVRSPFAHGSVIFKKDAFEKAGGYQQSEWPAEDYGLWLRMASFGDFANVDEPLYRYRENQDGISSTNWVLQTERAKAIRQKAWQKRQQLMPKRIQTTPYTKLKMGHFRLERITGNLLFCVKTSAKKGDLKTFLQVANLLAVDPWFRRKSARLVSRKVRGKHD